ncbi:MAG: hypothetical protein FJ288_03750 [Planctomycetes bacterium]|nr:hypothetical protein [Planctomycetota bacterium]
MASPVELIVGQARSGKARYVLRAYLDALARDGPGSCLMLVPTARRRRATESRLLAAQSTGVLVRPQVLEMHELADRLLAAAGRPVRRIGELARRQVIRRCLARLKEKEAAALGPARHTAGLVDALDALFRELKAARVEPDRFGRALPPGLRTPRNRALVLLYDEYQKALQAREVYDDAGQFWHAAAVVAEGRFGPFDRLALLAVDGFQDFAPAQLDMLECLSARAARTIITLSYDASRPNLFGVTGRTRERLLARFKDRLREVAVDDPPALPADLDRVRRRLFALPDASPPPAGGAIAAFRAAGRTREVEEVARRIADLLGASPAPPSPPQIRDATVRERCSCVRSPTAPLPYGRGSDAQQRESTPPAIAVIVRSIEAYAALVRQVFPRYGLPFRVEAGRPLADCPIVRAAMALVRLQAEEYSYRALARLIQSNYFDPSAFGADAQTARHAVRLAREANIWEGRRRYAERLAYLGDVARRRRDVLDDSGEPSLAPEDAAARVKRIDAASAFLERLFDGLAMPHQSRDRQEAVPLTSARAVLAARFRQVIRAAGLWAAAQADPSPYQSRDRKGAAPLSCRDRKEAAPLSCRDRKGAAPLSLFAVARDLKALLAFEDVLDQVALLDEGEAEAGEVTLQEFLKEVEQGLALASVPAEEPADAPVVVLDARSARALSFDHVFLLGLAEKEFPRRGRRHPFFDDAQRQDLRKGGVDLADAGHDAQQEMLLAYLAMTRARRTLTVSYSSLDAQGRPALASHYLEELQGLFAPRGGGPALPVADVGVRDLAVPAERLRAPQELLARTMFELWGPGKTRRADEHLAVLDALLAGPPAAAGATASPAAAGIAAAGAAETALAGLAVEWEREHGERFGQFDGVLAAPDILDDLCRRFPGQATMSARRLEAFGACPFVYFAGDVLRLAAVEEPSPDLGPLDVGLIYHGLLERFFSALAAAAEFGGRLTPETLPAALALFDKTAADYFRRLEEAGRVGSPAIWRVQKQNVRRDVRGLLAWHARKLADWRAAHTEVLFGATGAAPVEPPGRRDPIAIGGPHGPIRIRGRIDRIDLPAGGGQAFQVVDYKTSGAPAPRDMQEGTSFQLPIYLWAAREILPALATRGGSPDPPRTLAPGGPEERGGSAEPPRGARAHAFFLPVRNPRKAAAMASADAHGRPNEKFERALARAADYIRRFTDAMRRGLFAVYPRGRGGCSHYCDFHEICRFSEWRIRRKWHEHPLPQLDVLADDPRLAADQEEARP